MAKANKDTGSSGNGRLLVIGAAVVGLGGAIAYTMTQPKDKPPTEAKAPVEDKAAPSIDQLIDDTDSARLALDTQRLADLEQKLGAAEKSSEAPKKAQQARLAALTSLAVEATVRANALGDEQALSQATTFAQRSDRLLESLGKDLDPGARASASARLALARGLDVAADHPAVLLPSFRDRELQHAVLTQALWKPVEGEEPDEEENAQLVNALQGAADPSGLEQMLLVVALERTGDSERAATVADQALARAPGQPLAKGLLERVRPTQVAVAEPAAPSVPTKVAPTEPAPAPEQALGQRL